MKMNKVVVCLVTVALAVASAATRYSFVLTYPTILMGQELPSGDYRVELDGDKAMVRGGKMAVESPVKVEQASTKYIGTTVLYNTEGGKHRLAQIMVGGTTNKIVFVN